MSGEGKLERGTPSIVCTHDAHPSSFVGRLRRKILGRKGTGVHDGSPAKSCPAQKMHQHVISIQDIAISKELGRGEFGNVYQAAWQDGDEVKQVAVKQIPPERLLANPVCFLQEAAIMTRMCHENVIRLYGVVLDTRSIMLVSELALGSLLEHLQRSGPGEPFPVDVLCEYARQIAKGMHYLESQRLIHRDLAARNVLLCSPSRVKISDFGLSRSLGVGEDYYRSEFSPSMKLPIAWCAPECINYLRFTPASDVWAFGVTMWEMFTYGKMPWSGCTGGEILHAIDAERRTLPRPESSSCDLYKLMCECWAYEPERRPTFTELYSRLLPSVMPQLLLTIHSVAAPRMNGGLAYGRDEIIVLFDKCPNSSGAGHWLGAIRRTGEIGLFAPRDTVAYLEAEKPTSSHLAQSGAASGNYSESATGVEKLSGLSREQKKLLITEPRHDLKHVCHVGTDGSGFGLLNLDKRMLAKSVSPTTRSTDCFTTKSLSPHFSPTPPSRTGTTPRTITPTQQSHSKVPVENSVPALPPKPRAGLPAASVPNHLCPQLITTFHTDMNPPQLPPRPRGKAKHGSAMKARRLNAFPVDVGEISAEYMGEEADDYLNPEPTSSSMSDAVTPNINEISLIASGPSMPDDSMMSDESSKRVGSGVELDVVFDELRRDIDELTLSSQCDSDSRPLLKNDGARERRNIWRNGCVPSTRENAVDDGEQSLVRSMTKAERDKWEHRVLCEHKSVDRSLEKEAANLFASREAIGDAESAGSMGNPRREIIGFAARLPKLLPRSISTDPSSPSSSRSGSSRPTSFSKSATAKVQFAEWPEECMRAYKLMVQSGKLLKSDDLQREVERRPSVRMESRPTNTDSNKGNGVESTTNQLEYINSSLVESPDVEVPYRPPDFNALLTISTPE